MPQMLSKLTAGEVIFTIFHVKTLRERRLAFTEVLMIPCVLNYSQSREFIGTMRG